MNIATLLIFSLATWRLSFMLVHETGPYDIFGKLRDAVGVSYDEYGNIVAGRTMGELFACVNCMSVWVAVALFVLCLINQWWFYLVATPFAASGVATIINKRL